MTSHRSLFAACAGLILSALLVAAQGTEDQGPRLVFEHDGHDVRGFVLYAEPQQGREIRVDLGPVEGDGSGRRSIELPVLPPGTYTVSVAAYNAAGESPRTAATPARISVAVVPNDRAGAPRSVAVPPDGESSPSEARGVLRRIWRIVAGD